MRKKVRKTRGPKPDALKIDKENWENAVKKAVRLKKPKDGWPKNPPKPRKSD